MSFLAPLYALAALAIAAPILLHLLQRRPQGQTDFSSLMFLRASPPQLTRRHRLNNLLLLLLRGLALLLLAMAFARPFLRSPELLDLEPPSRSIALVIDTSASLRRNGLWDQTRQKAADFVDDVRPTDEVALIAFDRQPRTLVSFEAWNESEPSRRIALLREQLEGLEPTWHATNLDVALITASDALLQQRLVQDHHQPLQIVVLSDLQMGSSTQALQVYQWPDEISVDFRASVAAQPTNASLQALPPAADELDATQVRVLVRNEADSKRAQFQLSWEGEDDLAPVDVHVPPGQTRVVRISQPKSASSLTLHGDDQSFDNTLYVAETTPQEKQLLFVGAEETGNQSLFFYLRQATLDTRTQRVAIERLDKIKSLSTVTPQRTPLVVVAQPLDETMALQLRRYLQHGGRVLAVLEQATANAEMATFLNRILELPDLSIEPVETEDYAMLARIDFQHPLFAPFADPRFSDFTKIRFWKHHRLSSSHEQPWNILARFDDQLPALVEKSVDRGTIWILTSGWQPGESQLSLSTKFVPLLHGMFGNTAGSHVRTPSYVVGQPVPISPREETTTVHGPHGDIVSLASMAENFGGADAPGIYAVRRGTDEFAFAVNLAHDESRTRPLAPEQLEQLGIRLGKQERVETLREEQRQLRNMELESRQQLWRWGILAALVAIALETWGGGRASSTDT